MMEPKDTPPPNAEQAADFAALQAAANETSAGPPETGEVVAVSADLANELVGLISMAVATLSPIFPSLKETYTEPVTQAAAGAIAGVCNKHGWLQGGMFGGYGEEIACAAIIGPLALTTYQGIKHDMDSAKAKRQDKAEALPPVGTLAPAGSNTVTFGAPAVAETAQP